MDKTKLIESAVKMIKDNGQLKLITLLHAMAGKYNIQTIGKGNKFGALLRFGIEEHKDIVVIKAPGLCFFKYIGE